MKRVRRKQIVLVLFGGKGERFGADYPKQFALLGDAPMFVLTLARFAALAQVDEIYVVSEPSSIGKCRELIASYAIPKVKAIVAGKSTRQQSAKAGLEYLASIGVTDDDLVLIADGDRPNVEETIVNENFITALQLGACVTAIPVSESILLGDNGRVESYLDREKVYICQTPQTFRFGAILKAHRKGVNHRFTDDASLYAKYIGKVAIVLGKKENLKITTPEDVETYLKTQQKKEEKPHD